MVSAGLWWSLLVSAGLWWSLQPSHPLSPPQVTSIESKLDSLLDIYRQVLQKGPAALTLSSLPLFELDNHQHRRPDYQTTRDPPSPRGGDPAGDGGGGGGVRRSLSANHRGLRLVLAPDDDDEDCPTPDSAPPSYPPSTASLSPSPLLPPDSPCPTSVTPDGTSRRAHFPDPSTGGFTLRLPPPVHPSHLRCSAESVADDTKDEGSPGPSAVVGSGPDAGQEGDAQRGAALRVKTGSFSEGVWRRHLGLEVHPLLLLSPSPDETPSDWGGGLGGEGLSVRGLGRPSTNHAAAGNAHGDLNSWDGTELFISECKLDPEGEHFHFLSQGPDGGPSDLLHTAGESAPPHPKASADFLSQPPHIQLA